MELREAWDRNAAAWLQWARSEGHDHFYWRLNLPRFLELLPPAGRLTIDIGCGEGRLDRALASMGHHVVGLDASPALVRAASETDPAQRVALADAARLPLRDACADLASAFMSLQDIDDMTGAVREAARVLAPGGRFCLAFVHPLNSAGAFTADDLDGPFVIEDSYMGERRFHDVVERAGIRMEFHQAHRPLEAYARALEAAGFAIESLREPVPDDAHVREHPRVAKWRRIPCFLHVRAVRR